MTLVEQFDSGSCAKNQVLCWFKIVLGSSLKARGGLSSNKTRSVWSSSSHFTSEFTRLKFNILFPRKALDWPVSTFALSGSSQATVSVKRTFFSIAAILYNIGLYNNLLFNHDSKNCSREPVAINHILISRSIQIENSLQLWVQPNGPDQSSKCNL